jgi:hypothetical protein
MSVSVVNVRPGTYDGLHNSVVVVKTVESVNPTTQIDWERIKAVLDKVPDHEETGDGGFVISTIIFPLHSSDPVPATFKISRSPTSRIVASYETSKLINTIDGEHDLDQNMYALVTSFAGRQVLCLVPEGHPLESEILTIVQTDAVLSPPGGSEQKFWIRTKVFDGHGSFSKSQWRFSRLTWNLWFPTWFQLYGGRKPSEPYYERL